MGGFVKSMFGGSDKPVDNTASLLRAQIDEDKKAAAEAKLISDAAEKKAVGEKRGILEEEMLSRQDLRRRRRGRRSLISGSELGVTDTLG